MDSGGEPIPERSRKKEKPLPNRARESKHFADRLMAAMDEKKSCVVVGLDPRLNLLPPDLCPDPETAERDAEMAAGYLFEFNRAVIDAVARYAVAVKPQIAFYERYGWQGVRAYAETVIMARRAGLLVLGDVKRGDIGSTAAAYARGHFEVFGADAVTVNPYLGSDGIRPFVDTGREHGKGIFVLVKTSNPSSGELQDWPGRKRRLYRRVAELLREWAEPEVGERGYSSVGAVVGATWPAEAAELREALPRCFFLVPGYGAQGGTAEDCRASFNGDGYGAIVNSSRGIIHAYRTKDGEMATDDWLGAVEQAAGEMRDALEAVRQR